MSAWGRLVLGSLFGALVVLLIHPLTRSVLVDPFRPVPLSPWMASARVLPDLSTADGAAFAAQLIALDQQEGTRVPGEVLAKVEEALRREALAEPENAFWLHAQIAVLPMDEADRMELWRSSALCTRWDDQQNRRLEAMASGNRPWHAARLHRERKDVLVAGLVRVVGTLLQPRELTGADLEFRVQTIRAARVLRDGSRSISMGDLAVDLMNQATRLGNPSQAMTASTRLRLRQQFLDAVASQFPSETRREVERILVDSDSWTRLLEQESVASARRELFLGSAMAAALPGVLLAASGIGAALGLFGMGLARSPSLLRPPLIVGVGAGVGAGIFAGSQSMLAGISSALCLALYAYRRQATRTAEPEVAGSASAFLWLTGVPFLAALTLFLIGFTPMIGLFNPTYPEIWVNLVGEPALLWVCAVVVCLTLGSVPMICLRTRRDPAPLGGLVLQRFGFGVAFIGAAFAVVGTLATLAVESQIGDSVWRLVLNEPVYFLSR